MQKKLKGSIDSHQHNWQVSRFAYNWLKNADPILQRDYLPDEAFAQMQQAGIERCVLVQADSSLQETDWLLELAQQHPHIAGVVGWVDLTAADIFAVLDKYSQNPAFKGIRPSSPAADESWPAFSPALKHLGHLGLSCDLLVRPTIAPAVFQLIREHKTTQFIIDHLGGMQIVPDGHLAWKRMIQPLVDLPNAALKVSGYLAYAQPKPPTVKTLWPYVEIALELLGADRLLFGSDWPVCTLGAPYRASVSLLAQLTDLWSANEQANIWGGTACRVYRLNVTNQKEKGSHYGP